MINRISADQARVKWADVMNANLRGETVVVERYGKEVSAVVPYEEWQRLKNLHIAELKRRAEESETVPWEEVKAGLRERGKID